MPKYSATLMHDPDKGMWKAFHRLHDGGWAYETQQEVSPILDQNKAFQNDVPREMKQLGARRVASIPLVFIQKWYDELGIDYWNPDHQQKVDELLDSSEYKWLRTDNSMLSKRRVSKAQIERRLAQRRLWAEI